MTSTAGLLAEPAANPARRVRIASPGTAIVLGLLAVVELGLALALAALAHQLSFSHALPVVLACTPFAGVGCFVAYRQPANPVGWLLLALGTLSLLGLGAIAYSLLRYRLGHTGLPLGPVAAFVTPIEWVSVVLLLPVPVLLFPDGRLTGRWRWVLRSYLTVAALWLASVVALDVDALVRPLNVDSSGSFAIVDHPHAAWEHFASNDLMTIAFAALALAAVARQLLVFRGSSGERRQQLKWLLGGGAVCFVGLFAALASGTDPTGLWVAVSSIGLVCIAALPAGIGVGILKYRLYDIDRLISRTIAYTIVTGLLVGVFTGLVLLATRALPFSSPVGVAAATLAAAALFNPLRRRVQRLVDRRFNRARYDAEATVAAFAGWLRDAIDPETIRGELLEAAARTLEPTHASVWIRPVPPATSSLPGSRACS